MLQTRRKEDTGAQLLKHHVSVRPQTASLSITGKKRGEEEQKKRRKKKRRNSEVWRFGYEKVHRSIIFFLLSPRSEAEAEDGGAAGEERRKKEGARESGRERAAERAPLAVGMQPVSSCQTQQSQ